VVNVTTAGDPASKVQGMVMKIRPTIPDRSITREKLEYPTADVSFAYLAAINQLRYIDFFSWSYAILTKDIFADKAVWAAVKTYNTPMTVGRLRNIDNTYFNELYPPASFSDHRLYKRHAGSITTLAIEYVEIGLGGRGLAISCSGSTIKSLRYELETVTDPLALPAPNGTISATDTAFASGHYGFTFLYFYYPHGGSESGSAWLKAPLSPLPPALAVLEVEVEGSGAPEDPYRPLLGRNLVETTSLQGLPEFLYMEAKRYETLRARGFTEDEMKLLLGYVPQHQVDLDAVTWGAFEFSEKSPTNIIVITGDNLHKQGAVGRQAELARGRNLKVLKPPRSYGEAVAQYSQLKRDYPHWLAGKDNYAYQTLGLEELELFQNADFYYGELLEHRTHYQQLKQVPDWELRRRLEWLESRLERVMVLAEERDKHLAKVREVRRVGW
jgi:hypothetical protein